MATSKTIALCGAGMISGAHAMAAHVVGASITAVASRTEAKSAERASQLNTVSVSYEQLPAGADIVIVATPPAHHFSHTVHALKSGAAVIVEKPLVFTLDEADRLLALVEHSGAKVLYAENLAYAPVVHAFIKRVTTIGPLNHLVLKTIQSLPQWGDFTTAQWGGGALFDLGVHPLAIAVLIGRATGAGEVVALSATLRGEITDTHAEVHLRFESGLTATVTSSWEGEAIPTWDIEASSNEGVVRAELFPHLTLEHNGDEVALPATTAAIPMIEQFGYVGQLSAFIADLEEGTQPFMDVAFGRWIMEIVCAGYYSAALGSQEVSVPSGCDRFKSPLQLWKGF